MSESGRLYELYQKAKEEDESTLYAYHYDDFKITEQLSLKNVDVMVKMDDNGQYTFDFYANGEKVMIANEDQALEIIEEEGLNITIESQDEIKSIRPEELREYIENGEIADSVEIPMAESSEPLEKEEEEIIESDPQLTLMDQAQYSKIVQVRGDELKGFVPDTGIYGAVAIGINRETGTPEVMQMLSNGQVVKIEMAYDGQQTTADAVGENYGDDKRKIIGMFGTGCPRVGVAIRGSQIEVGPVLTDDEGNRVFVKAVDEKDTTQDISAREDYDAVKADEHKIAEDAVEEQKEEEDTSKDTAKEQEKGISKDAAETADLEKLYDDTINPNEIVIEDVYVVENGDGSSTIGGGEVSNPYPGCDIIIMVDGHSVDPNIELEPGTHNVKVIVQKNGRSIEEQEQEIEVRPPEEIEKEAREAEEAIDRATDAILAYTVANAILPGSGAAALILVEAKRMKEKEKLENQEERDTEGFERFLPKF